MKFFTSLEAVSKEALSEPSFKEILKRPIHLTIGNFDGVHLGHRALFQHLKNEGLSCVITFTNHPMHFFFPDTATPLITSFEEKKQLIEEAGIDILIALEFTHSISKMGYETFLKNIYSCMPFKSLTLGKGAALGHKRLGTEKKLIPLSEKMDFTLTYLPKITLDGLPLSSAAIRKWQSEGNDFLADKALGKSSLKSLN